MIQEGLLALLLGSVPPQALLFLTAVVDQAALVIDHQLQDASHRGKIQRLNYSLKLEIVIVLHFFDS